MNTCYVCGVEIVEENQTDEHIFLNALGGHLTSNKLICKKCNSDFGNDIDTELSNQFKYIATMLNIQRDRGVVQPFDVVDTVDNTLYSYEPGGKPVPKIPVIKQVDNYCTIKVANKKQGRKVLKGLKRKYSEIDIDKALSECKTEKEYLNHCMKFNVVFGGSKAFRSLCKTAVNFYLYKGGTRSYIEHLIPYIKGDMELDIVFPVYLDEAPINTKEDEILHSIIVRGDGKRNILFAYIELFDFYKVIAILNNNYGGNDIEFCYFFDVLQRKEVRREYNIDNVLCEKGYYNNYKGMKPCLEALIKKIYKKQEDEHINEIWTIIEKI